MITFVKSADHVFILANGESDSRYDINFLIRYRICSEEASRLDIPSEQGADVMVPILKPSTR